MKKSILSTLALTALIVSFTSCKDNAKAAEATPTTEEPTEEVIVVEEEEIVVEDATEESEGATEEAGTVEKAHSTSSSDAPLNHDGSYGDVKDAETVEVTYSYTVMGKAISGSKTFSGHQKEVETAVQKFSDSLKKIDPNIKITSK
ncbi:hypothetical protein [Pseudotamlana agarivorans]|uniref:hypothetical protein n=1 Tax=Pseudotamlana agarivorans TaxID=481183 RepID=UPI00082963E0|nr:hypothetical protein [Tamlana agarivorans]